MVEFVSYDLKEADRFRRGGGWKVNLFGQNSDVPKVDLQAFRIDMNAGQVLDSHFHIVDQFQIFIAGSGTIGKESTDIVTAHYADHHTGYGPLIAGPQGMSYLTLRPKTDAGLIKLSTPNVRAQLKPTKRRHGVSQPVTLSIPPVMAHREAPVVEQVMADRPDHDGMAVKIYRLGSLQEIEAPATQGTGGYYLIVLNGSLIHEGATLGQWSLVFVRHDDIAPMIRAGSHGVEVMAAIFPVQDAWMAQVGEAQE